MKCYTTNGKGFAGLVLGERPEPDHLGSHDVLVEVEAVSLNYRDLLVAKGQYGRETFPPFIPGSDMGGTVKQVGKEVTEFKVGDKVFNAPFRFWPAGLLRSEWARTFIGGAGIDGVLAERIVYPDFSLVKIPAHLSFAEGATFTIAGLTAWSALVTHGKAKPGDWVLLQGSGGVSIFAAQIAQMIGARTILTTAHEDKAKIVKEKFGVFATVNYKDKDWEKKVKEVTGGKGVDIVVDVAGGETLARSLKICNYGARVAVVGLLDSPQSTINVFDLIAHQVSMKGIYMESTAELRDFVRAFEASGKHPYIDRVFSFDKVREAYEYMESQKHIGKVVITM